MKKLREKVRTTLNPKLWKNEEIVPAVKEKTFTNSKQLC